MIVTTFPDASASTAAEADFDLARLADLARSTTAPTKSALPWIKCCRVGTARTLKGSLRHNANVLGISGIEGDYDGEAIEPAEAADLLRAAGIEGLIYTSPSHKPGKPRWRVVCPLSEEHPPEMRRELVGRLNHVLGGVLANESFTLSQSFYLGSVTGGSPVEAVVVAGRRLDLLSLPALYPTRSAGGAGIVLPPMRQDEGTAERISQTVRAIGEAFDLRGDTGRHQIMLEATQMLAPFVASGHMPCSEAEHAVEIAMGLDGREPNPGEVADALNGALEWVDPYFPPTGGAEFVDSPPPPRHKLFTSRDFRLDAHQGYVVKGLVAPGNVAVLLGHPGAGKSTLAPFLAYSVAQGRPFFDLRTRAGRVLIAAAEDLRGMEKRVHALGLRFGHSEDCAVTEADNLRDPAKRAKMLETIADFGPSLVVLDTIAAAFAGMDENTSQDMGEVVSFARGIAARGPAVLLIHHPAKAGDGTPRGHSSLNGTLDMVLTLTPDDVTDADTIVRGVTPKNRNGSTAWTLAFRKEVVVLGQDVEGDSVTTTLPVRVDEAEARRGAPARLSPNEQRALTAIQGSADEMTEDAAVGICSTFSTAEKPRDRLRAGRNTFGGLLEKGFVTLCGGIVRVRSTTSGGISVGSTQGAEFVDGISGIVPGS